MDELDGAATQTDILYHGIPPLPPIESPILNLPSQVYQGLEWIRHVAHELSNNRTRVDDRNGEGVVNELTDEIAVPLLELMTRNDPIPKYTATLGFAEDGETVLHNFETKETPHLLIVGGPDAGKTVMLRSIAASLALNNRQSEIQLAAICPITGDEERQKKQAAAWYAINYLPHMLCDIAYRHSEIVDLLTFLSNEIQYRDKQSFQHPRLIVLIDQVDKLISHGGRRCAEPILRLAQKGDDVGIHLVLTTQSLESATLSTHLLKELPTHLIGRPAIISQSQNYQFMRKEDLEQLLGEGDFLHQQGGGVKRMQGAFIGDQDLIPKVIEMNRHRAILLASPVQSRLRLQTPAHESSSQSKWITRSVDQVPVRTQ